jgi:hypothetical protein
VVHCRRILKWTYSTAFYSFEEEAGAGKEARERLAQHQEFFEFNQVGCWQGWWVQVSRGGGERGGLGAQHLKFFEFTHVGAGGGVLEGCLQAWWTGVVGLGSFVLALELSGACLYTWSSGTLAAVR